MKIHKYKMNRRHGLLSGAPASIALALILGLSSCGQKSEVETNEQESASSSSQWNQSYGAMGRLPSRRPSPKTIDDLIAGIKPTLFAYFNSLSIRMHQDDSQRDLYQKLFLHSESVFSKLDTLVIEVRKDSYCDSIAKEDLGSLPDSYLNSICISLVRFADSKDLGEVFPQLNASAAEQVSHLLGATAQEGEYLRERTATLFSCGCVSNLGFCQRGCI
jgi:hypothetical protein